MGEYLQFAIPSNKIFGLVRKIRNGKMLYERWNNYDKL